METPQREKPDKGKINSQVKHLPKDAQVVLSIMKELNVPDNYDPRIPGQLLEFVYRYVTCILDDAKVYANHARKKVIDIDDVKLATEITLDKSFTGPPPRHVLANLAEVRNAMPLPPIKPHCGLRLPPDRYCLTACNFKLRASGAPKKMTHSALDGGRSTLKATQLKGSGASGMNSNSLLKRPSVVTPKLQVVSSPKPVIKCSTTLKPADNKMDLGDDCGIIKMEVDEVLGKSMKREREEDEFEVVP